MEIYRKQKRDQSKKRKYLKAVCKHLPSDLSLIGGEVSLIVDDNAGESSGGPRT